MPRIPACPICGGKHTPEQQYSITRAGHIALATWRAEDAARKLTAMGIVTEPRAQASAPPLDVTGTIWGEVPGTDAAAARTPIRRAP